MSFNSLDFAIFLPIVFFIYWFVAYKNLKLQNIFLLISSYIFYGWWDYRFLFLIILSSLVDYWVGIKLSEVDEDRKRKKYLFISLVINLGMLGFFKYYNFFLDNFVEFFSFFGFSFKLSRINIILPVGISFYTFQTLSYSIDVYRRKIEPTRDIIAFLTFVSFFPQLVAGPIERAINLLPQFYKKREFNYEKSVDGLRQILWGLLKKIVIADNCAKYVNLIFLNYKNYSGSTLLLGSFLFAFQIYGDFSGYSDIAIGSARLFGISLTKNFAFPYFSRDIAEFWRRWHISLSTWFRDYLYIPLGGSRGNIREKIRNVMAIFIISGFWHGANWTFIAWGIINGLYFLPLMIFNKNRKNLDIIAKGRFFPTIAELFQIIITFMMTLIAWIFFRASTINEAVNYITKIFSKSLFKRMELFPYRDIFIIFIFIVIEWMQREKEHGLEFNDNTILPMPIRWIIYTIIIMAIIWFGGSSEQFIYFQF